MSLVPYEPKKEVLVPEVVTDAICGKHVAACTCVLPKFHEGIHRCDPVICGGSWSWPEGAEETEYNFEVHSFPYGTGFGGLFGDLL